MFQDLLNLVFALAQSILAVVATMIAVNQRREQKYEMRVENLKKMVRSIRMERYEYAAESLRYYRERFQGIRGAVADQVLFQEGWVQKRDDPYFLPLGAVRLNLPGPGSAGYGTAAAIPAVVSPTPKEGYAENAKFHCEVNLMNLPLYGLGGVHVEGSGRKKQVTLDIVKGRYYDFYDTCEVLAAEMAYCRRIQMERHPAGGPLPMRDRQSDVFDFTNRFVGIGINALTILQNVEDDDGRSSSYFLLHRRSASGVAEGANSYHVVPAGSYQPATVEFPALVDASDRNLNSTVVREFGEELLGIEEFADLFSRNWLRAYEKVPPASSGIALDR